jgi:hypothetical protein
MYVHHYLRPLILYPIRKALSVLNYSGKAIIIRSYFSTHTKFIYEFINKYSTSPILAKLLIRYVALVFSEGSIFYTVLIIQIAFRFFRKLFIKQNLFGKHFVNKHVYNIVFVRKTIRIYERLSIP